MNAVATESNEASESGGRPDATHLILLGYAPDPLWSPVVIRLATQADRQALERLAQLDSTRAPTGRTVIGEVSGRAVAAVSLDQGTVMADPFVASAEIVELVSLRARQLSLNQSSPRGRRAPLHGGKARRA